VSAVAAAYHNNHVKLGSGNEKPKHNRTALNERRAMAGPGLIENNLGGDADKMSRLRW